MKKISILIIILVILGAGWGMHKLIGRFINPRQSAGHLFLYFVAHFISVFLLAFIISFLLLHFPVLLG